MIGWIDGSAGASGDMLLGALVGAGVDLAVIQAQLDRLELGIIVRCESVQRAGLAATRVHVEVPDTRTVRHLSDIVAMFDVLDMEVARRARSIFERLAAAEARVHGTSIEDVHFHEVGALDSIADVVGVCAGFVDLGLDAISCSTLALGSGTTRGAHGPIPVPAPAVVEVLTGVAPVEAGAAPYESATPTGAALLAEWVTAWSPMPTMTVAVAAAGAGSKDTDAVANATRLLIGDAPRATVSGNAVLGDTVVVIEANVDDLDPRVWPTVIDAALDAGAFDAWVTPIVMKKGRPAHAFTVMCAPADVDSLRRVVFARTSTIGVRERVVERTVLDRSDDAVEVAGHVIRVKVASLDDVVVNRSVEWDDVVAAAVALGRPEADVLDEATAAIYRDTGE